MMQCGKCNDTNGPFIADVNTGKCLCEDCYMFEDAVKRVADLIRYNSNKKNINMKAVTIMDSIETAVFDELGIK